MNSFVIVLGLLSPSLANLVLKDGAYSGVQVRIGEGAPVGDCTQILKSLQAVINASSWSLHTVTRGGAWLRDVEVVLPHSWGRAACTPAGTGVGEEVHGQADIVVTTSGSRPRAVQAGGCGEQGEHLTLPLDFLALNSSDQGEQMAREWAGYRYGIFPEAGFPEDPLYPATYINGFSTVNNTGCPGHLFCPADSEYDRLAPTKQNLLCDGRSALETMMSSQDLLETGTEEGGRQVYNLLAAPRDPVITYTRTGTTQYVLLLDQDQPSHRWTHVKRALYQFIELLPEGSVLSIIDMTNTAVVLLPPTLVTASQREGLLGRIPRRGAQGATRCLQCGLQLAVDTLGRLGGSIVLVTSADMEGVSLPTGQHSIFLVSYRTKEQLLGRLPGQATVYSVTEEEEGEQNPVVELSEAFIDIINTVGKEQVEKVHQSSHLSYDFSGSFYIEEQQSQDITISLSIDDEQKVEMFEVKDPSGTRNIFSKFGDGVVVFRLPGDSKSGIWSFHARLYAEALLPSQEVMVTVLTRGSGVRARGLVRGARLVASVTSGQGEAVVGGRVTAKITGPAGDTQELVLRDSGLGYPDITRGDGLYTAMLTGFGPMAGYHSVRLEVEEGGEGALLVTGEGAGNCCGSWIESSDLGAPTGQFTRFLTAPSVYLEASYDEDTVPPSRIPDLRILGIDTNSSSVMLAWSAPGGDFSQGRAQQYELRCSSDPEELKQNFSGSGIVILELGTAGVYGEIEEVEAQIPWAGQLFYYGVVALDSAGNRGQVSNLAAAFIEEATTTRTALPLVQAGGRMEASLGNSSWLLDRNSVAMVIGVAGGVILVVVALVIGLLVRAKRGSKTEDKSRAGLDTYEAGFYPDIKISASEQDGMGSTREVYDWLEGSQGSSGSRPETAASTEESTASTGEEEEPASPHLPAPPAKGESLSFSYPPATAPKPQRPEAGGYPALHGRSQSYSVQARAAEGFRGGAREMPGGAREMPGGAREMPGGDREVPGGARDVRQESVRHYRHRAQHSLGAEGPQRKRRHESVV